MESKSATTAPNSLNRVFLGIGGNLGDRIGNLHRAVELIGERIGRIGKVSSVYLSEPWGFTHAKYFTNIVAKVYTPLSADEVLTEAFEIETKNAEQTTFSVKFECTADLTNDTLDKLDIKIYYPKASQS